MKDRFKRYLEREFRAIAPTLAAMQYREEMLENLMNRAQELRIKGITDEELIYDMCIDELGDFRETLLRFESREEKTGLVKRKAVLGAILTVGAVLAITIVYLVTSFATGAWAKTWLIMVGGIFAGLIVGAGIVMSILGKKQKFIPVRGLTAMIVVLLSVFLFLMLQILASVPYSWLIFLAMVILVLGLDTMLAYITGSKIRHLELGVFMEVFCVLLYVILGIVGIAPWHPTWILCLGGIVGSLIMVAVLVGRKNRRRDKADDEAEKKLKKVDEQYYTMWKD